ncbi:hypothetical protein [Acinetobacter rongchengensis]|uniref:Lipoprotein n=1 Tax=Acinetobacter rongchengensis TaxID=2419601 RepID=A0A3A8FB34_9GAMM|nr:hypothetical protein [Acinetobacter rongchengensis]RKG37913.1 hypothetical protein D7V20_09190 [Acinetobacter rongchengensis]
MKKLLQGAVLPFVIFTSGILLLGCDQATSPSPQEQHTSQSETTHSESNHSSESEQKNVEDLKQGNMFYIARDVANVQLKTGNYVEKLQQAQSDLQQAIETKDQTELQNTVQTLTRELQAFNTALISLDLKSQEIDGIRQQVLHANKQVLNSSLLNGNLDISKVDFNKIQQQMDHIQTDMLKLAGMMIPTSENDKSSQS